MTFTLGAIRWDAQWTTTDGTPAWIEERTLSHPDWQHMAPPHAVNVRPNRIQFDVTQARMDTEIGYANALGPNFYWAFLMYSTGLSDTPNVGGMRGALDLYISSIAKGSLKWCMIQKPSQMGSTGNYTSQVNTIADLMVRSDYQRVLANRPLLYIYAPQASVGSNWANNAAFATMITALRAAVTGAGAGDPYIVVMQIFGGADAEAFRVAVGADAVTLYATGAQKRNNRPYTELASYAATFWTDMNTAAAQVPLAMAGWDRRPREARPGPWEPQYLPGIGSTGWYQRASNSELAAHVAAAKAFVVANPSECPAETALIYSWNEFSEGGSPLCPTRADVLAGTHTARLAAVVGAI